jgi:hypothetical protein
MEEAGLKERKQPKAHVLVDNKTGNELANVLDVRDFIPLFYQSMKMLRDTIGIRSEQRVDCIGCETTGRENTTSVLPVNTEPCSWHLIYFSFLFIPLFFSFTLSPLSFTPEYCYCALSSFIHSDFHTSAS